MSSWRASVSGRRRSRRGCRSSREPKRSPGPRSRCWTRAGGVPGGRADKAQELARGEQKALAGRLEVESGKRAMLEGRTQELTQAGDAAREELEALRLQMADAREAAQAEIERTKRSLVEARKAIKPRAARRDRCRRGRGTPRAGADPRAPGRAEGSARTALPGGRGTGRRRAGVHTRERGARAPHPRLRSSRAGSGELERAPQGGQGRGRPRTRTTRSGAAADPGARSGRASRARGCHGGRGTACAGQERARRRNAGRLTRGRCYGLKASLRGSIRIFAWVSAAPRSVEGAVHAGQADRPGDQRRGVDLALGQHVQRVAVLQRRVGRARSAGRSPC